jgi:hypothetical protein
MTQPSHPCPECAQEIPVCTCGEWGCGLSSQFYTDCPSTAAANYRRKRDERDEEARRMAEVRRYLAEEEQRKREEYYGVLFECLDR